MKLSVIVLFFTSLSACLTMPVQALSIEKADTGALSINVLASRQNNLSFSASTNNKQINYQELISYHNKKQLWFDGKKLNLSGLSLLSLFNDLGIKTLLFDDVVNLMTQPDEQVKKVDQQLTQQLFTIATLFNGYQFKPLEKPKEDIFKAVKNQQLASYIDKLLPQFDQVVRLRTAIAYYQKLATKPWPIINEGLSLILGQGHQEVIKLRRILVALADLNKAPRSRYRQHIFDPEVITALKQFQARHGLKSSGKLNAKTIRALNSSPAKRIEIMQINLWRWLSLPSIPPKRYVIVNIPAYRLMFIENQQETLTMPVIVGDNQHPTPIMVTQVNSLTINPQWTPTYNIIHKELLVENSINPGSLRRQNFKLAKGYGAKQVLQPIFNDSASIKAALGEYKLIQAAGKNNALGKYRFNIKNFHSVYLHDTPAKNLFIKKNRALSHGCVRLQSAHLLAQQFMVNEPKNKQQQIKKALNANKSQHIKLNNSIEVYLTYQTVWLTATGKVHWAADIYQLDQPLSTHSQLSSGQTSQKRTELTRIL